MSKIGMIIFLFFFHMSSGDQVNNPVIWQDFADLDIIRVNNTFYYSASTMHFSPGAPILRSYDLVNWEYLSHSVPRLDFDPKYNLNPETNRGYVGGIWASFLNYRKSNKMFYWGGCIDFVKSYIYTSPTIEGPWQKLTTFNKCYYDCGLLIDDDDKMYVSYAKDGALFVAELAHDAKGEVKFEKVYTPPKDVGYLEGTRFYKRNGQYYIFTDHPANGQYILKAGHPFGPYVEHRVLLDMRGPLLGGGIPHQGGMVETQTGQWYYMAFVDAYPGGRVPVLAPITWTADGWPQVQTEAGAWGQKYPFPNLPVHKMKPMIGIDTFTAKSLGPQYEWNHNPDTTKFSVNNGLHLQTASVTKDLYSARNTLTHRIQGPTSTATVVLDLKAMHDGDHTGLAIFRTLSASIGVNRIVNKNKLVFFDQVNMDNNWKTTSTGKEVATADLNGSQVWLRCQADIHPGAGKQAHFSYSTDGKTYHPFGPAFVMSSDWKPFMGYRFAVFNYATKALGGLVTVQSFEISTP